MRQLLTDLNQSSAQIEASALISTDGIVIAAELPDNMSEDVIGTMSAALHSISSRGTQELVNGTLEEIIVKTNQGYIVITQAGRDSMLTVVTQSHIELAPITQLNPIIATLKQSAEKILLEEAATK